MEKLLNQLKNQENRETVEKEMQEFINNISSKTFENLADFEKQRNEMFEQAEKYKNDGDYDNFNITLAKVKTLQNRYDDYKTMQANLNSVKEGARANVPSSLLNFYGNTKATFGGDIEEIEFRTAFMNYATTGVKDSYFNSAEGITKTSDVGVMIPQTVMNKIIEKATSEGMILPLVNRTNYKGGVTIPTSNMRPTATWVNEGEGSPKQKKTIGTIMFAHHKLRCAISMTLETATMSLSVFEKVFVEDVVRAMTVALEQAILNGNGTTQPKGILTEEVDTEKVIEIQAGQKIEFDTLIDAESKLEMAYQSGTVWFMNRATAVSLNGLKDANGNPIMRMTQGLSGGLEYSIFGRKIVLTDYLPPMNATIEQDECVAFLFNPKDYTLNTNLNMTIKKYEDNEADDFITKAIMLVDGKVVDKNSLIKIVKKQG